MLTYIIIAAGGYHNTHAILLTRVGKGSFLCPVLAVK